MLQEKIWYLLSIEVKNITIENRKLRPQHLEVGMIVYVLQEPRIGKLDRFYSVKFIIREVRDNKNVVVETENGKQMLKHKDKVKQCHM